MSKVAIITDSTAYIPKDLLEQYPLWVVPQVLIFGEETLEDGVDIQPQEFYQRLQTESVNPTTSQVTPASFNKMFSAMRSVRTASSSSACRAAMVSCCCSMMVSSSLTVGVIS